MRHGTVPRLGLVATIAASSLFLTCAFNPAKVKP